MRDYIDKSYSIEIDFLDYSSKRKSAIPTINKNPYSFLIDSSSNSLPKRDIIYNDRDTNTAFLQAKLTVGGKAINLEDYDKVVVAILKGDGHKVLNDCSILNSEDGIIEIPFTTQSLICEGLNHFEIVLYKGLSEMVSPRQSYRVMSSLIEDDMIESTNEYGILLTLVSRCEDSLRRIGDIENTESNRVAAEELRKENEEERIRAEIERKEEFKKYNEVLFDKTNVNQLAGGYHQVKTLEDRDSIPIYKKAIGMLCYVESEDTIYQYKIEKGLLDWVEFRVGGGGSLFETLAERDSIPESKLFVGYSCFVLETMAEYYYSGDGVWNKTSTNSVHIGNEQPNDTSVLWIDDEDQNVDTSLDSDIITEIKILLKRYLIKQMKYTTL